MYQLLLIPGHPIEFESNYNRQPNGISHNDEINNHIIDSQPEQTWFDKIMHIMAEIKTDGPIYFGGLSIVLIIMLLIFYGIDLYKQKRVLSEKKYERFI